MEPKDQFMLLFFARKPKAVHLLENAYGKLAFQYAFPRRYRARARDRDGAERRRGAQHGGGKEARARDRDGVERRRVRSTAAVCIRRNKEYLIKKEENR